MSQAQKMSVTLTLEQRRELEESVSAGEFASTSEAVRDALRLWSRERAERAERMALLRARVHASVNDGKSAVTADEVSERLDAFHRRQSCAAGDDVA